MTETIKELLQTATRPITKWRDPDFLRKYYREKRRKDRGGLKRHPNVLDDGTLWSESLGKEVVKEKKPKICREKCQVCGKEYFPKQLQTHLKTKFHNLALTIVDMNIKNSATPINKCSVGI